MSRDHRDDLVVRVGYTVVFSTMTAMFVLFLWQGPTLDGNEPWPARHPLWSSLIVFVAVAILGRLYLFMRRVESR